MNPANGLEKPGEGYTQGKDCERMRPTPPHVCRRHWLLKPLQAVTLNHYRAAMVRLVCSALVGSFVYRATKGDILYTISRGVVVVPGAAWHACIQT